MARTREEIEDSMHYKRDDRPTSIRSLELISNALYELTLAMVDIRDELTKLNQNK